MYGILYAFSSTRADLESLAVTLRRAGRYFLINAERALRFNTRQKHKDVIMINDRGVNVISATREVSSN